MFTQKPFDPLLDPIRQIMRDNDTRRIVEANLNRELGIQGRRALPHERLASYDKVLSERIAAALSDAKVLKEEHSLYEASLLSNKSTEDEKPKLTTTPPDNSSLKAISDAPQRLQKEPDLSPSSKSFGDTVNRSAKSDSEDAPTTKIAAPTKQDFDTAFKKDDDAPKSHEIKTANASALPANKAPVANKERSRGGLSNIITKALDKKRNSTMNNPMDEPTSIALNKDRDSQKADTSLHVNVDTGKKAPPQVDEPAPKTAPKTTSTAEPESASQGRRGLSDFEKSFAKARATKGKNQEFTWNGKSYSTNYKEEGYPKKRTMREQAIEEYVQLLIAEQSVKVDVENIVEMSKQKIGAYVKKAISSDDGKRYAGVQTAAKKLAGKAKVNIKEEATSKKKLAEAEQIEEMSKKTLTSYVDKAGKRQRSLHLLGLGGDGRADGMNTANKKLAGKARINADDIDQKALDFMAKNSNKGKRNSKLSLDAWLNEYEDELSPEVKAEGKKILAQFSVNEEQINEVSKAKLGKYINKAKSDMMVKHSSHEVDFGKKIVGGSQTLSNDESAKLRRDIKNRSKGIDTAVNKLTGKAKVSAHAGAPDWPNPRGQHVKEDLVSEGVKELIAGVKQRIADRANKAVAPSTKKSSMKPYAQIKEEEQLNEISKDKTASYLKWAVGDKGNHDREGMMVGVNSDEKRAAHQKKSLKRLDGILTATNKLSGRAKVPAK